MSFISSSSLDSVGLAGSVVANLDFEDDFISRLRGGALSPNIGDLATGWNETDLQLIDGLYHLAYDDGTTVKLATASTVVGLIAAAKTTPIDDDTQPRYPTWAYDEVTGIYHFWVWDQDPLVFVQRHYTASSFLGAWTYQGLVLDENGDTHYKFGGGEVRQLSDGYWWMSVEDVNLAQRKIKTLRATHPNGPWTDMGYVFSDTNNNVPLAQRVQENDPGFIELHGHRYIIYAAYDDSKQRIFIVEVDPENNAAITPPVCLVPPLESWHGTKVFSPVWLGNDGLGKIYYAENADHLASGYGSLELGLPLDDGRRTWQLAGPNFASGEDIGSGIPFTVYSEDAGDAVLSGGGLVLKASAGNAYGFLPWTSLADFTIEGEFTATAFPSSGNTALLFRLGPENDSSHQIRVYIKNTAGTVAIQTIVAGAATTTTDWSTTLVLGKRYRWSFRKTGTVLEGFLNGASGMTTGSHSGDLIQLSRWHVGNLYMPNTAGGGPLFAAGSQFFGTIWHTSLVGAALPTSQLGKWDTQSRTGVLRTVHFTAVAGIMTPRTTNGPAAGTFETSVNKLMVPTFDFDQTTEEGLGFWWTPPTAWDGGTITARFHWSAAGGTGTVKWDIAGRVYADDDALDQALGTEQTAGADTLLAVGDEHITATTPAITLAGTLTANRRVYLQVTRDVADTLNADAQLLGVTIEYAESVTEPSAQ